MSTLMAVLLVELLWLLVMLASVRGNTVFPSFDHIYTDSPLYVQQQAAEGLIKRLLPDQSQRFIVQINNTFGADRHDTFILQSNGSHSFITASSGVSASWGFYYFLTQYCGCQATWAGQQLSLPKLFPLITYPGIIVTSNDRFHYYDNVCTEGYSYAWWNWSRWERELDWMAMRGINLPLAYVAQEVIWQRVYKELGIQQPELDTFFAGPGYLPWGRMGNVHGLGGPLSDNWMQKQLTLQHKILHRMREFGMVPVQPAFNGHVPEAMTRLYPTANITQLPGWNKFNCTYSCSYFLDPRDPLFTVIGMSFLQHYDKEFGLSHIYNVDTFNELTPVSSDPAYLDRVGFGVYASMVAGDDKAIWLMQGWMFYHDPDFWGAEQVKALVTSVPVGKMIILDLAAEVDELYSKHNSFYGQPFIWGLLQNFGGTNDMAGSLHFVNTRPFDARGMANSTMVGLGMSPEGIGENEVMFEFMSENWWRTEPRNISNWVANFTMRRYGKFEINSQKAWQTLASTIYNRSDGLIHHGKTPLVLRPSTKLRTDVWYNITAVGFAYQQLVWASDDPVLQASQLFRYDFITMSSQIVDLVVIQFLEKFQKSYKEKDLHGVKVYSETILRLIPNIDDVLMLDEQFWLKSWLDAAKSCASNQVEEAQYEYNARTQITLWGPQGEILDYAAKHWAGLMKEYYYPRWLLFFKQVIDAMSKGKKFDEKQFRQDVFEQVEEPFTKSRSLHHHNKNPALMANGMFSAVKIVNHLRQAHPTLQVV